jgi:hypothetical protein
MLLAMHTRTNVSGCCPWKSIVILRCKTWSADGEKRNAYRILEGKIEGKRPLERPRRRWMDNIKMDLREIGWGGMDCIDLAHDREQWTALVNKVMNLRVPQYVGKFLTS